MSNEDILFQHRDVIYGKTDNFSLETTLDSDTIVLLDLQSEM